MHWRILERFNRVRAKVYAAVVIEDVPFGWQSHVFVMRVTGLYPMADNPKCYKWLTISMFIVFGIVTSLTMFVNYFLMDSFFDSMFPFICAVGDSAATMKAISLYWQRNQIPKLFTIHERLWRNAGSNSDGYDRIARINYGIHVILTGLYMGVFFAASAQTIYSQPDEAIFSSTAHYPDGLSQYTSLYVVVLLIEIFGCVICTVWVAIVDTLNIALMNMAWAYVVELKNCLRQLGSVCAKGEDRDARFYQDLMKCCMDYEDCLR